MARLLSNYISFRPQDAQLPTYIRFAVTPTAFQKMAPTPQMAIAQLTRLSTSRILMAVQGKRKRDSNNTVEIFTAEGTYLCKQEVDSLLIIDFYQNNLRKQNYVMKHGVCFQVSEGIIIQFKMRGYEYYFDIVNGTRYPDNAFASKIVIRSVDLIFEKVAQSDAQAEQEAQGGGEDSTYKISNGLSKLLQTAENYSILSSQLEEQNALMQGNVAYDSIEAIEYDRIDRVAYQFGVTGLNEDIFKVGVQVEIEDKDQVRHAAEVIELVKADADSPATAIKLLFNEQISISQFNSIGWFNLSFSTVNKDVQLAANEKIRLGEAKARYMDAVLARKAPAGFDNKDLSAVRAALLSDERPPNESQMKAICAGINTQDVFLVMGPPGTGKTTVILEWVKYFVNHEHKRVLVSSQNNKAVDNVLARIAEEKDIDIIRIGSEAKLQSEVIPFMFENKVAALRRSIVVESDGKRQAIDRIIGQWAEFSGQLNRIRSMQTDLDQHYLRMLDTMRQSLVPKYEKLQQTLQHFREQEALRGMLMQQITALGQKLKRHEEAGNFLTRFLTGFGYKSNLSKMKLLIPQFDEADDHARTLAWQYQFDRDSYQAEYERILNLFYRNYCEEAENVQETFRQLSAKPDRSDEDIWDLFGRSRSCPLASVADCAAQQDLVTRDTDAARQLQQILTNWQADMDSKQNYALNEIVLESVDLVGATCIGINSQKRFANLDFDVTIIDEAGQIQVHNALVPMSVSNKLIMLGDHKQIPPNADPDLVALCEANDVETGLLSKSLFEQMYEDLSKKSPANTIMLDTQYRMPAQIADTISDWFYDGAYYSPGFKQGLTGLIPKLSASPYIIIDTSAAPNRHEKKIEGAGSSNALEASIVADIVRHLASDPENDLKEIGVISAYKSQVKLIKNRISRFLPRELTGEMVATLDSFQGQERDIILYSFTKSSTMNPNLRRIGFLNELRRLNVAMSRCKKTLVLIGDMEFLGGCRHCDRDEDGEEIYKKSEREFSDFINKMLSDVRSGKGELLTYQQFLKKMKGGDT